MPPSSGAPAATVRFGWAGFARGLRCSPPLILAGVPFGVVTGLTAQVHGLSLAEATLMSLLVFAGSAQLLALGAWTLPVSFVTVNLTSVIVNLRFLLMGPLLAPWLDSLRGWRRWLSLYFLIDHNWALALKEIEAGQRDAAFLVGSGIPIWFSWIASTVAGHLLGSVVAAPAGHPVFFAALSVFIALLVPMWRGRGDLLPWVTAALVAYAVSRVLPGTSWHIVAGAIAGGTAGLARERWRRG
jgi:4-azaleucine resistance transporter AzlC